MWVTARKHERLCTSMDIIIFLFGYKCVISIFRVCNLHVFLCLAPHAKCNLSDSNLFLASFLIISSHIHIFFINIAEDGCRGVTHVLSEMLVTPSVQRVCYWQSSQIVSSAYVGTKDQFTHAGIACTWAIERKKIFQSWIENDHITSHKYQILSLMSSLLIIWTP